MVKILNKDINKAIWP